MTTIQIRTNEKTKKTAMLILDKLGLDLSTAINIYLVQIIERKGIPFNVITENGLSSEEELSILKDVKAATQSTKKFTSAKSMHKTILGK